MLKVYSHYVVILTILLAMRENTCTVSFIVNHTNIDTSFLISKLSDLGQHCSYFQYISWN